MNIPSRRSELLMPAGSLEKLKIAVLYGADAVYMGTPDLSLRVKSQMSLEDVIEGIEFAHAHHVRVYLTLNLFSHNKDIDKLPEYVEAVRKVMPDGLIVADPGVFMFVREHAPELELHVSTQANVCSWQSVKFWQSLGAKLCVLGREVSYAELTEIREKCQDIKLEAFVHGSMCMTYSGRCLLSNFMAERGANQGACANSCRWKYKVHMKLKDGTVKELNLTEENMELFDFFLEEEMRPGELMEIHEDERGSYILNSRDLCIMPKLEDYLKIGVDSLKVEGRGKSPYYAGLVARAYRMAIDDWYKDPIGWSPEPYMKELATIPNRGYTLAFHEGRLTNYAHGYDSSGNVSDWEFAGMIEAVEDDAFVVAVKNRLIAGDVLEFVPPKSRKTLLLRIYEFIDAATGKVAEAVNAGQKPMIRIPFALFDQEDLSYLRTAFPPLTLIRKEKALTEDEWQRMKLDMEGQKIELGGGNEDRYDAKRNALQTALDERQKERSFKTPRVGTQGCCGRGCNGCLIFWHDDSYAKARDILAKRKQGEMLEYDGRTVAAE
ncbi:U32 family peptidase [Thalassospira sp.]|uniref:U32 family peptidase n=1 Tax=Thalassospira sp. TaxID=1912094 RepID=UPI002734FD0C|nr:U32 family peptidase [Thalassospira sp.]MDP2696962.1 U32 family peptidase C-terminal domain-containing protein [Thalassospira sp.]